MQRIRHLHRLPITAITLATVLTLLIIQAAPAAQAVSVPPGGMPFKPIELLEPLPDGTTAIAFTGAHPLEPLNRYLKIFLPWAIGVSAGLCVLMIIIGGFQIMLSGGDQAGQGAGKDRIKAAIIGLLILVFSATILNFLNASYFLLMP